jgi:hypothetical protein
MGTNDRPLLIRHINGKRKNLNVTRYIWEDVKGPIPDGLWVLHTCDNGSCVNPDHLYLGTHKDNMRDMARSGIQLGKILKTHCPRGHPYDLRYFYGTRYVRICSICNREKCRVQWLKRKARLVAEAAA